MKSVDRRDEASTASSMRGLPRRRIGREPGLPQQCRAAISNGPATQEPPRPASPAIVPIRVDSSASRMPAGTPIAPAAERRVAEHALEQERLVDEGDVQRAVDEERRQVDRRERARPEQARAGRAGAAASPSGSGTGSAPRPRSPIAIQAAVSAQSLRLAADEPERQAADREGRDHRRRASRTGPVGLGVARFRDVAERGPQREREERDVDQERDPPADGVDDASRRRSARGASAPTSTAPRCRTPAPRSAPSKAWVMRDSEPGTSRAPVAPWRSRKTTSHSRVGARPHSADVAANPARPMA